MTAEPLHILYTGQLRGDLHLLPRLYTTLQYIRAEHEGPALLLDLGEACDAATWHCEATEGRSTLVVLDGMGYHAVNVTGYLDAESRDKLAGVITCGMVDDAHTWRYHIPPVTDEGIIVSAQPLDQAELRLNICLTPSSQTQLVGRCLHLAEVDKGQIGVVSLDLSDGLQITVQDVVTVAAGTAPNPTIVGSVDFVESEARYYQQHRKASS